MTRKKRAKPPGKRVRTTTPTPSFLKLEKKDLGALVNASQDVDLAMAEAQNLTAQFQLMVAKELKRMGMPIQTSAICMTCGTIRPIGNPCPECPVPAQQ